MATDERAEQLLAAIAAWHAAHPQESFQPRPRPRRFYPGPPEQESHSWWLTPAGHAALARRSA